MDNKIIIPDEIISTKVYHVRDQKVMLDSYLSELYGVGMKAMNQRVQRNITRFPDDFMFRLTKQEFDIVKLQSESTEGLTRRKKLPYVFTEQGVLMLSGILDTDKAISINLRIIRGFTQMREMLVTNKGVLSELNELKDKIEGHDERIDTIYNYLTKFVEVKSTVKNTIGFRRKKG